MEKKINYNQKIRLLFISPKYEGKYECEEIDVDRFNKNVFECDVKLITNNDIDNIIKICDKYDYVINLCDGYIDNNDNIPNVNLIRKLEENKIRYTGGNEKTYSISKTDLIGKIPTPKSLHFKDYNENTIKKLNYPLFIKPNNLGCSEFIDNNSIVNNKEELDNQLNKIIVKTRDIIIQEYIDGSEYTALVFKNKDNEIICLDPIELIFKTRLKYLTHDIKMTGFDTDIDYNYDIDIEKKNKIRNICIEAYKILKLNSYVRIDLRELYIIDINSNPEFLEKDEEGIMDTIIKKYYDIDKFIIDILHDSYKYD